MSKIKLSGICTNCGREISKNTRSILAHSSECFGIGISNNPTLENSLLLLIQGKYAPEYWLVLKAKLDARMKKIDNFIKDFWVECCGHLSQFSDGNSKISMTRLLSEVFSEGRKIDYVYDFGSSTKLSLSMIQRIQDVDDKEIQVLFRNKDIEFSCSSCENKAIAICPNCVYEDAALLCEACVTKHKCVEEEGEDFLMPIINSPRAGVCGYTGPDENQIKKYFPKEIR